MGRPELHCCVAPPRPPSRPARASAADDQSRNRAVCLFVPSALAPAAAAAAARVCINTGLDALAVELAGRERRREAPTADASARGAAATSLMMMMCIRERERNSERARNLIRWLANSRALLFSAPQNSINHFVSFHARFSYALVSPRPDGGAANRMHLAGAAKARASECPVGR